MQKSVYLAFHTSHTQWKHMIQNNRTQQDLKNPTGRRWLAAYLQVWEMLWTQDNWEVNN